MPRSSPRTATGSAPSPAPADAHSPPEIPRRAIAEAKPAAGTPARATAKPTGAAGRPKATTGEAPARLLPGPGEVVVRMYRQGLGDCFLLAFATDDPEAPRYVLIDCGVHSRQDDGPARLEEVLDDLVAATGGRLDVVVATHEHADHLSGFVQKGSPFLDPALTVGQVWLAWTEQPGDRQADALRRRRNAAREAIRRAVDKLQDSSKPRSRRAGLALHEQILGLGDFEQIAGAAPALDDALAASAKAKGPRERPSSNEVALEMLVRKAGPGNVRYCMPEEPAPALPGVDGVQVYVLGPPRDESLLKKDLPTGGVENPKHETYLSGRSGHQAFVLSPGLDDGRPIGQEIRLSDDLRYPFDGHHRRPYRPIAKDAPATAGDPADEDDAHFRDQDNYFGRDPWRRIEDDWLGAAEALALDLDRDTNNTSLVLAFELGPPGEGDVLLFVGDAQVGNWLSWRRQSYRAKGGQAQSADELLARTVLYKVGHHGSHNATVKLDSDAEDAKRAYGLELMPSRLVALVPVDQDAANKPRPWHMPHPPLYHRLLQKAGGRVLCSDGKAPDACPLGPDGPPPVSPSGPEWEPVPGLSGCRWRTAARRFRAGPKLPLFFEIALDVATRPDGPAGSEKIR